jgi:shikimate kinase / 3-dehydroquinate synthase
MHRPLLLSGFMATGKTTVGQRVAALAGCAFVDLDLRIEAQAGKSVRRIFEESGEEGFRRVEAAALDELLAAGRPEVIALGGGALLARERRLAAIDRAVLVGLSCSPEEVLRRSQNQPQTRPLLSSGDPRAKVASLLESRAAAYAECPVRLATDGKDPDALAAEVLSIWRRDPIGVAAGEQSYAVDIGAGIAASLVPGFVRGASRSLLISDTIVGPLHAGPVAKALGEPDLVVLPEGEINKTLSSVEAIWQRALAVGADRSSVLVGLGGGVVTDITGFAAATWMRGVPWVALPTTLLAMVDASVGGKTGVDLGAAKNGVGAFWQPSAVVCDVAYTATESARNFTSALSEVVKTALIGDAALLERIEANVAAVKARDLALTEELVRRSVRVKARIVGQDARESGIRAALNLGHTIGHALEAAGGFGRLTHGEAVSLGLVAALRLGRHLGLTPASLVQRVTSLLARLGLPTDLSREPLADALGLVGMDKKRRGSRVRFVGLAGVEQIEFVSLELDGLKSLGPHLLEAV